MFKQKILVPASLALMIAAAPGLYYQHFLQSERFFHVWDKAVYHELALQSLDRFRAGILQWLGYLRTSLADDYNALFTLPVSPLMAVFGEDRTTFLLLVYGIYFTAYLLSAGLFCAWLCEGGSTAFLCGIAAAALTPAGWAALLHGMPDIGAAAFVIASLWVYLREDRWSIGKVLLLGFLLATMFLFRRHFGYAAVSFLIAAGLHQLYLGKRNVVTRWVWLAGVPLTAALLMTLAAPGFVHKLVTVHYNDLYASYQQGPTELLQYYGAQLGWLFVPLAAAGLWLSGRKQPSARLMLGLFAAAWLVVWLALVKQPNRQYTLHALLPVFVTGMGCMLHWSWQYRRGAATVLLFALAANFANATLHHRFEDTIDGPLLAAPYRPLVREDYDDAVRMVHYLHEHIPQDAPVLVGANSQVLNDAMLRVAEERLYGRGNSRLKLLHVGYVDSRDASAAEALIKADYALIATPVQHHLALEQQQSVAVVVEWFTQGHASAFEALPQTFTLSEQGITRPEILQREPGPVTVTLFRRMRPFTEAEKADTRKYFSERLGK